MNLPIKLVDLVTLLFVSLLVVIIIFIILQRNIKRFKLRNVKDPHFLTCKSIPRGLKDSIIRKHQKTHEYIDPPLLFTKSYQSQDPDRIKSMVIRMKAFDTSKFLENALGECGYKRPSSVKFEEFIESLMPIEDVIIPKEHLHHFRILYISALFDPEPFDVTKLRELNRLTNTIIQQLAVNMQEQRTLILRHLLDLDESGDFDLAKNLDLVNKFKQPTTTTNYNNKEVRFNNNKPSSSKLTKAATSDTVVEDGNKKPSTRLFQHTKNKGSVDKSNKEQIALLDMKEKTSTSTTAVKYEEIKDTSLDSSKKTDDENNTKRWSTSAANESMNKNYENDDSESEQIPLVTFKKHKKKSSHGAGGALANIISSTAAASGFGSSNIEYSGALNQGFNETNM